MLPEPSTAWAKLANVAAISPLACAPSCTPTGRPIARIQPLRWSPHDSVTWHPPSMSLNSYRQLAMAAGPIEMAISKTFPGSHSTTVAVVFHRRNPFLLDPEKMAPGAGPVAPLTHLPPTFSGENSPMRGRSETSSHTVLAGAAMSRVSATGYVMGLHDSWPDSS